MPSAFSDGIEISYDDRGHGEPALLLLPGWCGSRAVFDRLASQCALQRRILSLDWRGHGRSAASSGDFNADKLVEDALAVIAASTAEQIVPVALSHAGWVAIELRRRLGARIPKLVLLDWIVLDPPAPFLGALRALQDPAQWQGTRDQLFHMWLHGVDSPELAAYLHEDMGTYGFDMWARAGREISAAYSAAGNALRALSALDSPPQVLHMYAQPDDAGYLAAQQSFSAEHRWFKVVKLDARSHFPMLEVPEAMAVHMEEFIAEATVLA